MLLCRNGKCYSSFFAPACGLALLLCSGTSNALNVLIFDRTPHACDLCDDAMEEMFRSCPGGDTWTYRRVTELDADPAYGGITPAVFTDFAIDLYVQPGGESPGNGKDAFDSNAEIAAIKQWVEDGGKYYGSCWGGYAIGNWVFKFITAGFQPERFVNPEIAESTADMNVQINWLLSSPPSTHLVYFQDGPTWFLNRNNEARVTRIAEYTASGNIAAMVFAYGSGTVGAAGVHFEGNSQYDPVSFPDYPPNYELGCMLVNEIMSP